jgi:uncharacterized repeat protein (TIGR01451 family)
MVNGRASSGGRTGHTRPGRSFLLLWLAGASLLASSQAGASLTHEPNFPHIKTAMVDYRQHNTPEELRFMAAHYDLLTGSLEGYGDGVQLAYTNYYCMYVGNREYEDARQWAAQQGVDFEAFFIHYAEETEGTLKGETHTVPAGSRVPTYGWYGTEGDLTLAGARVVMNVGNPNYRAWKLDYLDRRMTEEGKDAVAVDNTRLDMIVKIPSVTRGGLIAEYPVDPGPTYGNDTLTLFAEFKQHFGEERAQIPNIGPYAADPRLYAYVWGMGREASNRPNSRQRYDSWKAELDASRDGGVEANIVHGIATAERYTMPMLANFYMVANETCYFQPLMTYILDGFGCDPRENQWFDAIAYDIGAPRGDHYVLKVGIDPSSPVRETMTAVATDDITLTDTSKAWAADQMRGLWAVFPSGYTIVVYRSGDNWVRFYRPGEALADGIYQLGTYTYEVYCREYDNALVIMRPKGNTSEVGDASAVDVALPTTDDNPSGAYYVLTQDGTLDPTLRTTIALRGADGAILVKESKAAGSLLLHMSTDRHEAAPGSAFAYTIEWRNTTDTTARNATISSPIPAETVYVAGSAEATGGQFDGTRVMWDLGDVAAGASGSVSFQVRVQ